MHIFFFALFNCQSVLRDLFFFILVQLSSPSGDLCEKRIQTFFWSCRHSSLLSSFCEPFSCSSLEMMDLAKKTNQKRFFPKQYFFKSPLSSFCCMSYDRSMTRGVISAYWSVVTNDSPVLRAPGQSEAESDWGWVIVWQTPAGPAWLRVTLLSLRQIGVWPGDLVIMS